MGYTLFVTEKPSVAQNYKDALQLQQHGQHNGYIEGFSPVLNKDIRITWAVGHLIGIGTPDEQKQRMVLPANHKEAHWTKEELPLLPETFFFRPNHNTINQFNVVKSLYLARDIDAIYYAGDAGREGIYIQALIRNQIFGGVTPRFKERVVWIDSYTDEEILNGIRNAKPYAHYQNMIQSGYKRAVSDWLIGMNLTRALTLSCGGLITIGRVQTPTLAMVVERQNEIDNFKVEDYYGINAAVKGITETAKLHPLVRWKAVKTSRFFESPLLFNENGFKQKSDAESLLTEFDADKRLTVAEIKTTEKKEYAPLLFNLTDLQAYCAKTLFISPAETLAIAQSLYEKKLTTYPRTDARVLSSAVAKDLSGKLGVQISDRYVDDNKITDHYAIIPTFLNADGLTGNEKIVYAAIFNRFKAILMPAYIYDSTVVTWVHRNGEKFFSSFKQTKQLGWKKLYTKKVVEEPNYNLNKGETYAVSFMINAMQTTPPTPYTTGTLTEGMEQAGKLIEDEALREQIKTCGIGTTATRAGIIENLCKRGYITVDKKQKVAPTEKGKEIIPIIKKVDVMLTSPEKTAEMEQKLHDIADGKLNASTYQDYIEQYICQVTDIAVQLTGYHIASAYGKSDGNGSQSHTGGSTTLNCPFCDNQLKNGPYGWYCPNKDFSFGTVAGHKMSEKDLDDILTKGKTKSYTFTSKTGKKFKARLIVNAAEKKTEFEFC